MVIQRIYFDGKTKGICWVVKEINMKVVKQKIFWWCKRIKFLNGKTKKCYGGKTKDMLVMVKQMKFKNSKTKDIFML